MRTARHLTLSVALILALSLLARGSACGHAFPDHAEPRVGATLTVSPGLVRIWFDGDLEPLFSTLTVRDASGRTVDMKDSRVDLSDATLLEVSLPRLMPGVYRVLWSVVARDGHRTSGDYTFTVK
ncbi:MAG TPA: copper resistance CopC family protein [Geobacteraceae bacterium]|nr:copper resistance CopC family protein [Geobacteraceae bacterium]